MNYGLHSFLCEKGKWGPKYEYLLLQLILIIGFQAIENFTVPLSNSTVSCYCWNPQKRKYQKVTGKNSQNFLYNGTQCSSFGFPSYEATLYQVELQFDFQAVGSHKEKLFKVIRNHMKKENIKFFQKMNLHSEFLYNFSD